MLVEPLRSLQTMEKTGDDSIGRGLVLLANDQGTCER